MKRLIAILCAVVFVVAAFTIIRDANRQAEWEESRRVITIRVQRGDTMDGFWVEYAPDWMGREQYRAEIMELNDMDNSSLRSGQNIKLYIAA
jgi:hypothetical protein